MVQSFRDFGGSEVPSAFSDDQTTWPEARRLWDASTKLRTDIPVLSGALLLYLTGRFEFFVRQVVQTIAENMADNVEHYAELPDSLRKELSIRTFEVAQNPRRYGFDKKESEAFVISLARNLSGDDIPLRIDSAVLSITAANMKDRMLADLMKRIGMKEFWKEIGKQTRIKRLLGTSRDGETTSEARNQLNKLMDERNQIAHPTSDTLFPDSDQVAKGATFLKLFSEEMTEIARVYLHDFNNSEPDSN
jgi:hypothetical protein